MVLLTIMIVGIVQPLVADRRAPVGDRVRTKVGFISFLVLSAAWIQEQLALAPLIPHRYDSVRTARCDPTALSLAENELLSVYLLIF